MEANTKTPIVASAEQTAQANAHVPILLNTRRPHITKHSLLEGTTGVKSATQQMAHSPSKASEQSDVFASPRRDRRAKTPSAPSRRTKVDDNTFWQAQFSEILKTNLKINADSKIESTSPSSVDNASLLAQESEISVVQSSPTSEEKVHSSPKTGSLNPPELLPSSPKSPMPKSSPVPIPERNQDGSQKTSSPKNQAASDQSPKSGNKSLMRSKSESTQGGLRKLKTQAENTEATQKNRPGKLDSLFRTDGNEAKEDEHAKALSPSELKESEFISRRDKIALEIYKTECGYVASLQKLVQIFLIPLREKCKEGKYDFLTAKEITDIFSNLEMIRDFNTKLRDFIAKRIHQWSMDQKIADIFIILGPFLKIYTQYVNNYDNASSVLKRLYEKQAFRSLIQEYEQNPDCCGLTLQSFLIMPVQRVPRYVLLFQELQKYTDQDHADYIDLSLACGMLKDIADQINEKIREDENARKFFSIQHKLVGFEKLILPHRRFLGEIKLTMGARPSKTQTNFFLFNDMLVTTNSINSFLHCEYELEFDVSWISDPYPDQLYFEITCPEKKFSLSSATLEEKRSSYNRIYSAMKDHFERSNRQIDGVREAVYTSVTFGTYSGGWLNGKLHGKGVLTLPNKDVYDGEWEAGVKKGKGRFVMQWPEPVVMEGNWMNDKLHGEGSLTIQSGIKYVGYWVYGQREGKGKLLLPDESVLYEGQFHDNTFHGYGTLTVRQGTKYSGFFRMGLRHGNGLMVTPELQYDGDWFNDKKNGKGKMKYSNGDSYTGPFVDDQPHGTGEYIFSHGDVYTGTFSHGKMDGVGKIEYKNGDVYSGDITDGKKHGFGQLTHADNTVYVGGWVNDRREGKGVLIYPNGNQYDGLYKDDKKNGTGTYKWANGGSFEGNFVNDLKEGKGVLRFRLSPIPGDLHDWVYEGFFKEDKMHGQGKLVFPDGSRFEGNFVNNSRDGKGVYYPRYGDPVTQFWNNGTITRISNSIIVSELEHLHRFC